MLSKSAVGDRGQIAIRSRSAIADRHLDAFLIADRDRPDRRSCQSAITDQIDRVDETAIGKHWKTLATDSLLSSPAQRKASNARNTQTIPARALHT